MRKTLVVVFLGPPGSGKGTQAKRLETELSGLQHVATGDLFRREIARMSDVGKKVEKTIREGHLVNDQLTFAVLESQLFEIVNEKRPFCLILDGYPRNGAQVADLLKLIKKSHVLTGPVFFELDVPRDVIVDRVSGRLVNPRTGNIYHRTEQPPKVPGRCDVDGGELIQRPDDRPEVIGERFDIYQRGLKEMSAEIEKGAFPHHHFKGDVPVGSLVRALKSKLLELCEGLTERA